MQNCEAWHAAVYKNPGLTYLNTGSISLIAKVVVDQAARLREQVYGNPWDFVWRSSGDALGQSGTRLAQYVGTNPERLIFVQNVSQAINFVSSSINLAAGGEIVMSDHEYGAMRWAWYRAAQRLRLPVRNCTLPTGETT